MDKTIPALFQKWGRETGDAVGFGEKSDGEWVETSWKEYAAMIRRVGRSLIALGVAHQDAVAIVGFNRSTWVIADVATMSIGAISVGVYPACSAAQLSSIVTHAEPSVVFVDDTVQLEKVLSSRLPSVRWVVTLVRDLVHESTDPRILTWEGFLDQGSAVSEDKFQTRLNALLPDDLAMLVYTSGTTGAPRAVMLTHRVLLVGSEIGIQMIPHRPPGMRSLSYLPLAHIAERGLSVLGPALLGYAVFFAESVERLPQDLLHVRPTFFLGVPRLYEKIQAKLESRFDAARGVGGLLLRYARTIATQYVRCRRSGAVPSARLERRFRRASRFVLSRIHGAIGWDRSLTFLTGAAPISVGCLEFFASIGVLIQEVYGLSETTGTAAYNRENATVFGSVGRAFDGVEVLVADDGEVLVRGGNVFTGYYKDAAATAAILQDGWLHTGDLGEIDGQGFLTITGRSKDLIVTAGGKNVAPLPIEKALKNHPLVQEAVLIGDRRKYVSALIVVDRDVAAASLGDPLKDATIAAVHVVLNELIESVNEGLSRPERIKKFLVLPRPFEAARGELTPTQKIVRPAVQENFRDAIESLYEAG